MTSMIISRWGAEDGLILIHEEYMKFLKPWLVVSVAACLTACDLQDTKQAAAPAGPPPASVAVTTIETQDVPVVYEYVGQVAGSREVEIRARVTGIIQERLYEEGSEVKAGTVLFRIEPYPFEVKLAEAEADLARARAQLKQANREYQRIKPLVRKKLVSQNQLDDAESQQDLSRAAVKLAQAKVKSASIDLSYTQVKAPISGVVGRAMKMEGGLAEVGSNSLLTAMAQTNPVYVNFGVAEQEQLRLKSEIAKGALMLPKTGFLVDLATAEGERLDHSGNLDFQDYKVDATTGNFAMRATIPNDDGLLAPGQFVRVRLLGATRPQAVVLPQRAVLDSPDGKFVYTVGSTEQGMKIALKRLVDVGEWVDLKGEAEAKSWIIRSGLKAGDEVVVDGAARIFFPGMPINPAPSGAEAAPPGAADATATAQ